MTEKPAATSLRNVAIEDFERIEGHCRDCGNEVDSFFCNQHTCAARPEAHEWDWWVACSNIECAHSYGEGSFQDPIEWIVP